MRKLLGLCSVLLLAPLPATAQELSNTFIDVGFNVVDPPGRFGRSDIGILVRGSYAFDEHLFARGGLQMNRFDTHSGSNTLKRDILSAGLGFSIPTHQDVDIHGAVDLLFDFGDADDAGFRLEGGARTAFIPGLDSSAGLRVARLDNYTNAQVFVNSYYEVAPQLSLGGELAVGDFDELMLGARYRF